LLVKSLAKPDDAEWAVAKRYALLGLHHLFAVMPEPLFPRKTVFQKRNEALLPASERATIKALIAYVTRQAEPSEAVPEEAIRFVRRAGIRALGGVRVESVKANLNQVEARPALVLLKAARSDG